MNKTKSPTLVILLGKLSPKEEVIKSQLNEALEALGVNHDWFDYKEGADLPEGDIALFIGSCSQELLNKTRDKKMVPIVNQKDPLSKDVDDFVPLDESGDGFVYDESNVWHIVATVVKAAENYKFPYDWKNIVAAGQSKLS